MKIDFANLQRQYQTYKKDVDTNIQSVLNKSNYIMGEEINSLESSLQIFTGAKHAIVCSSGTDALMLAMMAIDIHPGDEIITTPFTFISTAETISLMGAKPVFVDIEADTFNIDANLIEEAITPKTKAIMPVSLFGQAADMGTIKLIAEKYNLQIIIDGAQSFGATYKNKTDSNLGDISATSFFPAKPLGCYGDGGAVFTNNKIYADKIRMMRIHGQNKRYHHKYIGIGGRLDTIQAAVLLAKLPHYEGELSKRQLVSELYSKHLKLSSKPIIKNGRASAWSQYTVRIKNRDQVQDRLKLKDIPTAVYYPIPLHLQECFKYLGYKFGSLPLSEKASEEVISLPMNAFLKDDEIEYITENFNKIAI